MAPWLNEGFRWSGTSSSIWMPDHVQEARTDDLEEQNTTPAAAVVFGKKPVRYTVRYMGKKGAAPAAGNTLLGWRGCRDMDHERPDATAAEGSGHAEAAVLQAWWTPGRCTAQSRRARMANGAVAVSGAVAVEADAQSSCWNCASSSESKLHSASAASLSLTAGSDCSRALPCRCS